MFVLPHGFMGSAAVAGGSTPAKWQIDALVSEDGGWAKSNSGQSWEDLAREDDAYYIYQDGGGSGTTDRVTFTLASILDPATDTGWEIEIKHEGLTLGSDLQVVVFADGVNIKSAGTASSTNGYNVTPISGVDTSNVAIPDADMAIITDFSTVEIKLQGVTGDVTRVYYVHINTP